MSKKLTLAFIISLVLVTLVPHEAFSQDTLINLVQWPEEDGGNGHWYGIIALVQPWTAQRDLALTLTHDGEPGHLATIGSPEENQFIVDNLLEGNTNQPSIADEFYLGGWKGEGLWAWLTGENLDYVNWASREPSGDGIAMAIWGASRSDAGKWNDLKFDGGVNSIDRLWALVEFGVDTIHSFDTLINLVQWPDSSGGNNHWYGILKLMQPWEDQRDLAASLTHDGIPGHLATIADSFENRFIVEHVLSGYPSPSGASDQFYLGGSKDSRGIWSWVTHEVFGFANWNSREPSGDGRGMAMLGPSQTNFGKWNDLRSDGPIGSSAQQWAVVEFGLDDNPTIDTVAHLQQWSTAEGGNGHWYGILPILLPWSSLSDLAGTLQYDTLPGHLATIANEAENQFIVDHLLSVVSSPPGTPDQYYLGGFKEHLLWTWETGEPFNYRNWYTGEPNGDGVGLAIWGASTSQIGKWNDLNAYGAPGSSAQQWAIIEFGIDEIVIPDTLTGLVQWTLEDSGNGHWYAILSLIQPWSAQRDLAASLTHDGLFGHLATIGSAEENQFLVDHLIAEHPGQPSAADVYYLGGLRRGSQWQWLTAEYFSFTDWDSSQLNSNNTGIAMQGATTGAVGQWQTVVPNGPSNSTYQSYALIEFGTDRLPSDDTLINLTRWPGSSGGNDHWYGILSIVQPWTAQLDLARQLTRGGVHGHLATIESQAENDFILNNVLATNTNQPSVADEFYLGGFRDGWVWTWTNEESFDYTNWSPGEPSGDGKGLAMWGASSTKRGKWNDVPHDGAVGSNAQLWAVVEFDEDSTMWDTLVVPSMTVRQGEIIQPFNVITSVPISGIQVPLKFPSVGTNFTISTKGLITESWGTQLLQVNEEAGYMYVVLVSLSAATMPPGEHTIFNIRFDAEILPCSDPLIAHWDTTFMGDPLKRLTFIDTQTHAIAGKFDRNRDQTTIMPNPPGDIDNSGSVDITDLIYLVTDMWGLGVQPDNINVLDVNGDCAGPDIADAVRMIEAIFGPASEPLLCGCLSTGKKAEYAKTESAALYTEFRNGRTTLYLDSDEPLPGVQFSLNAKDTTKLTKLVSGDLDLLYEYSDNELRGVVLNMKGRGALAPGTTKLLELPGEASLTSALVADSLGNPLVPILNRPLKRLPTTYELSQNYPNPFNPSTTIRFALPQGGQVMLEVYNIAGQRVIALIDGFEEAGVHSVIWDGRNESRSSVASGIYFYKLEVNGFRETKKMLLLK